MSTTPIWEGADALTVRDRDRARPEVAALPADTLPTVPELFTFMRDAELRFETLRLRIEERSLGTRGDHLVVSEVLMRHVGLARLTTTEPDGGTSGNYELWLSDGETVRTYSAAHRVGTRRPVRPMVRGVSGPEARDLPGRSRIYVALTDLPMETLPDTFVHPGGYCQNVLGTGRCWIPGTATVAGRQAILVECDHPRTIEMAADRPDFHIQLAVDRADGVILRLTESIGGVVTRRAEVVDYRPNAPLVPTAFDFSFPPNTTMMF